MIDQKSSILVNFKIKEAVYNECIFLPHDTFDKYLVQYYIETPDKNSLKFVGFRNV